MLKQKQNAAKKPKIFLNWNSLVHQPAEIMAYAQGISLIISPQFLAEVKMLQAICNGKLRLGYNIEQVQQFTLHDDWKTLARYTHLKPEDID